MRVVGLFLVAVWMGGCALPPASGPAATEVSIRAAKDANHGFAVDVDVVAVYDPAVGEQLATLSAAEWFERKPQMLVQWSPERIAAWSFQVPPGTLLQGPQAVIYDAGASELFLFAQYFSPGVHRRRLQPQQPLACHCGRAAAPLDAGRPNRRGARGCPPASRIRW